MYESTQLSRDECSIILDHLVGKIPLATRQDDDNLILIKSQEFTIVLCPPKGYIENNPIRCGWIELLNVFHKDTDYLETIPMRRGITIDNYIETVDAIKN